MVRPNSGIPHKIKSTNSLSRSMATKQRRIDEALAVLTDLEMPRGQRNERSALSLLALLDLGLAKPWAKASAPLMGITPYHGLGAEKFRQSMGIEHTRDCSTPNREQLEHASAVGHEENDPRAAARPPRAARALRAQRRRCRRQNHAADLRPRVRGGAISASAGMLHSRWSFQAILIVRGRFLFRMSDARWREPSRRPRSAWV